MGTFASTRITSNNDGDVQSAESLPTTTIFSTSQMFPAKDGTWLMVDFMSNANVPTEDQWYSWYVIESK